MIDHRFSVEISIQGPGPKGELLPSKKLSSALMQLVVNNSLTLPAATFSMQFDPTVRIDGHALADVIPPYGLVKVLVTSTPQLTEPRIILIGVIDQVVTSEQFQQGPPARTIEVRGRSLAGVLSDQHWWHHSLLASYTLPQQPGVAGPPAPAQETPVYIPPAASEFFRGEAGGPGLFDQVPLRLRGFLAVDPNLWRIDSIGRHPTQLMALAFKFFMYGMDAHPDAPEGQREGRPPFCRTQWGERHISYFLKFSPDLALAAAVDPDAKVMRQLLPTEMPNQNCWGIIKHFAEPVLVEVFSDSFGTSFDDATCEVIVRKPPFAGHIAYQDGEPQLKFSPGEGFYPTHGKSLFDAEGSPWWTPTVEIDNQSLLAAPELGRSHIGTYNIFRTFPNQYSAGGQQTGDGGGLADVLTPPLIDDESNSPSSILKYGPRPLEIPLVSVPWNNETGPSLDFKSISLRCLTYAALLRAWLWLTPLFWRGSMQLIGNPNIRAGIRLHNTDTRREFYVESVSHRFVFGPGPTPSYTTTVGVTRGWRLAKEGTV